MKSPSLALMLFTNDVELVSAASAAGVDRIVIDLEQRGKDARQHGYHLECNRQSVVDIARIKAEVSLPVLCRINSWGHDSPGEIEAVLEAGADIVMLPMFRSLREVVGFLSIVNGRARTSLLFETREAVSLAPRLIDIPFDEVYVGLNDLAISFDRLFCFELLQDGTVDRIRDCFPDKPFGFGGVTILDEGRPLPTRCIVRELARLRATQVIARRAFQRDIQGRDMKVEVGRIGAFYGECLGRSPNETEADRKRMQRLVMAVARRGRLIPCN